MPCTMVAKWLSKTALLNPGCQVVSLEDVMNFPGGTYYLICLPPPEDWVNYCYLFNVVLTQCLCPEELQVLHKISQQFTSQPLCLKVHKENYNDSWDLWPSLTHVSVCPVKQNKYASSLRELAANGSSEALMGVSPLCQQINSSKKHVPYTLLS